MTNQAKLFVRLLDEGTPTARPAQAVELGHGLFKLLPTENYDPKDEKWEFPPGSIVRCEKTKGLFGDMMLAVAIN